MALVVSSKFYKGSILHRKEGGGGILDYFLILYEIQNIKNFDSMRIEDGHCSPFVQKIKSSFWNLWLLKKISEIKEKTVGSNLPLVDYFLHYFHFPLLHMNQSHRLGTLKF